MKAVLLAFALIVCGCLGGQQCAEPYSQIGAECCLDANGDGACDTSQAPTTATTVSTTTTAAEIPSTTSPTTTSSSSTTTPRSTSSTLPAAAVNCSVNSDCGPELVSEPFCDGNTVRETVSTPVCKRPGTPGAKCDYRRSQRAKESCRAYCVKGACYPAMCFNGIKDHDEEAVDCGLNCPPCGQVNAARCVNDSDCGSAGAPTFTCYNGNVVSGLAGRVCMNRTCADSPQKAIVDVCIGNATCIEGKGRCTPRGGTCNDCVMNQNEEGVDCGGFCSRCAVPSGTAGAYMELNLSRDTFVPAYGNYSFRYMDPVMTGTCTTGIDMQVRRADWSLAKARVSRIHVARVGKGTVGFLRADDSTASVWVEVPAA